MVSTADLLNTQAGTLFMSGADEPLVPPPDDTVVVALMALAEQVNAALVPATPTPGFVKTLGHDLARTAALEVEVFYSRERPWIIGAAAVGSALSLLGLFHFLAGSRRALKRAS